MVGSWPGAPGISKCPSIDQGKRPFRREPSSHRHRSQQERHHMPREMCSGCVQCSQMPWGAVPRATATPRGRPPQMLSLVVRFPDDTKTREKEASSSRRTRTMDVAWSNQRFHVTSRPQTVNFQGTSEGWRNLSEMLPSRTPDVPIHKLKSQRTGRSAST